MIFKDLQIGQICISFPSMRAGATYSILNKPVKTEIYTYVSYRRISFPDMTTIKIVKIK